MITPGRYRHYKGKDYQVLGCAKHTETEEEFVVYRALYGDHGLWVRPKHMFEEEIEKAGVRQPRFQRLEEDGDGTM
ncbi:MAG: DUF1653 domain-containing protein [Nitrospirales bacterium]|nr:DUF1653 domain-containing protein [Nitrospira sp.]MDR4501501.1 DUF1653 domain-containing protein [Nitrospirales bacterium]